MDCNRANTNVNTWKSVAQVLQHSPDFSSAATCVTDEDNSRYTGISSDDGPGVLVLCDFTLRHAKTHQK